MEDSEALRRYAVESIGGFLGGSVSVVVGHPFDTIKVRQQAGQEAYAGAVDCVRTTLRTEGPRALFKGMLSPLLTNSAMGALTFSTWQEAQRLLHVDEAVHAPLGKVFAAGAIAGVVQCVLATPMELVRTKLQVQHGHRRYQGNFDLLRQVFHTEGLAGVYRGNVSMVLREGPAYGIYFSVYAATKSALCPGLRPGDAEPMWVEAAGGAVTGAVTWAAVMPMDVVSTRIQSLPEADARDPLKRSVRHVAQAVWREGGARAFYKGLPTAILRGVVLNALVFPVYETTVRRLSG